jgi:hypothetical protein
MKIVGLLKSPRRRMPPVISTVAYSPDLAPTILDVLGIRTNASFICGKSILPMTSSRTGIIRDTLETSINPIVETRPPSPPPSATDAQESTLTSTTTAKEVRQFLSYYTQRFHNQS